MVSPSLPFPPHRQTLGSSTVGQTKTPLPIILHTLRVSATSGLSSSSLYSPVLPQSLSYRLALIACGLDVPLNLSHLHARDKQATGLSLVWLRDFTSSVVRRLRFFSYCGSFVVSPSPHLPPHRRTKTPRLVTPRISAHVTDVLPTQTASPRNSADSARLCIPCAILLAIRISSSS